MGAMVSDENGAVLAHSFPAFFDTSTLKGAADMLQDKTVGLEDITGGVTLFDLRFELGRLLIKPLPRMFITILCQPAVNIQLLSISLNVAIKKLEKIPLEQIQTTAAQLAPQQIHVAPVQPAAQVAQQQPQQPQNAPPTFSTYRAISDAKGVLLSSTTMQKTASTYWESMSDSSSVNRETALEISNFFRTGPFKKLTITNCSNGISKHVPVSVIQHDRDHVYDGKIILTKALSELLKVNDGDQVRVEVVSGGGILGWEGI